MLNFFEDRISNVGSLRLPDMRRTGRRVDQYGVMRSSDVADLAIAADNNGDSNNLMPCSDPTLYGSG